jgi:hypothetical protein
MLDRKTLKSFHIKPKRKKTISCMKKTHTWEMQATTPENRLWHEAVP